MRPGSLLYHYGSLPEKFLGKKTKPPLHELHLHQVAQTKRCLSFQLRIFAELL